MSTPSTQDFIPAFDPTGYASISGAQLGQLIAGAIPFTDKGIIISTVDVAGVPVVPDAVANPKWQNYIWLRFATAQTVAYAWVPDAGDNFVGAANIMKWYSITLSAIPDGGVTNAKIANLAVSDSKISDVNWGKVTGAPVFIQQSGTPSSGDLTGTYDTLVLKPNIVTGTKIASFTVIHTNLATQAGDDTAATTPNASTASCPVDLGNNARVPTGAAAKDLLVVNATAAGYINQTCVLTQLAEPVAVTDANKLIKINNAGTAYEKFSGGYVTKSAVAGAVPGAGATTSIAHTLGARPQDVRVVMVCGTNDAGSGYSAGDEVDIIGIQLDQSTFVSAAFNVYVDATNVNVIRDSTGTFIFLKKGTGVRSAPTDIAHFTLKAYCQLFQ